MKEIFGDKVENNRVFINWFTGLINFRDKTEKNKILRWDGVFYKIFEYETVLGFQNGNLISQGNVKNYAKIKNGINRKDKSKVSKIIFEKLKKKNWKSDYDCSEKYLITISENGKISNVRMTYSNEERKEFYEEDEYEYCISKVRNALTGLQFDILKDKGKPISEDIYIEIWQEKNGKLEDWTR